jgi:hypothetical protein
MLLVLLGVSPNICHLDQALNVFFEAILVVFLRCCRRVLDVLRLCSGFSALEGELELKGVSWGGIMIAGVRENWDRGREYLNEMW